MVFAAFALLSEAACVSTSSFNSARTLEPGDVRHTLGISMYAIQERRKPEIVPLPMPLYALTYGVTEDVDMTGLIAVPGRLRFETKYNPLRSDLFDLAIAPALYAALYPSTKGSGDDSLLLFGGELPLIADLNMSQTASLVVWAGPAYGWAPGIGGASYIRTGLGFNFRGDGFSVQPELNFAYDPVRATPIDFSFGFGFTLGDMPVY